MEADPGRPVELMEGKDKNFVSFRLTAQPSPHSGGLQGLELWNLNVFGSLDPFGTGERINQVSGVLTPQQRSTSVVPPSNMNFGYVQHYFNMSGVDCSDITHLCAELVKGTQPNPDFQFSALPDERVLIDCFNIHCMGIVIKNTDLELYNGPQLLDEGINHITFSVEVTTEMDSGDAIGDNLWRLEAYLSNDYAGYSRRNFLKSQLLNIEQSGYDIHAGERVDFNNLAIMVDFDEISCEEQMYLCVELFKGNDKIKFMGSRPDSLRDCQELACVQRPDPITG